MTEPTRPARPGDHRPGPTTHVTPLLNQLIQQSLDADYEHVAARKQAAAERAAAAGEPVAAPPRRINTPWIVALVVFGVMIAVSAVQTRRNEPVEELGRTTLVDRITTQRERLDRAQNRVNELRDEAAATQQRSAELDADVDRDQQAIAQVGRQAGFASEGGVGVVVEVRDGEKEGSEVRDDDLATAVNSLWQAGATGVAINGQRLTAVSAIRNSGTVIRVSGTSLSSPYRIEALGDPDTLQEALQTNTSGVRFLQTAEVFGFTVRFWPDAALNLPAADAVALRSATTLDASEATMMKGNRG